MTESGQPLPRIEFLPGTLVKGILVPSGRINPNDSLEGTNTEQRLKLAVKLWRTGEYDFMVFSGGAVGSQKARSMTDAEMMERWLSSHCIDAPSGRKLLIEDESLDTFTNVRCTLALLNHERRFGGKLHGFQITSPNQVGLCIPTHTYHGRRFKATFRGYGWNNIQIADTGDRLTPKARLMEELFYVLHLIDPKGTGLVPSLHRRRLQMPGAEDE